MGIIIERKVLKMKVLAKTEYQDMYRITDGVLLVVNKFVYAKYPHGNVSILRDAKIKCYHAGCQSDLKVLKEDYYDKHRHITIPKGTVLYYHTPVVITDKSKWKYEIKTTGNALSGNSDKMLEYLSEIRTIIEEDE